MLLMRVAGGSSDPHPGIQVKVEGFDLGGSPSSLIENFNDKKSLTILRLNSSFGKDLSAAPGPSRHLIFLS